MLQLGLVVLRSFSASLKTGRSAIGQTSNRQLHTFLGALTDDEARRETAAGYELAINFARKAGGIAKAQRLMDAATKGQASVIGIAEGKRIGTGGPR